MLQQTRVDTVLGHYARWMQSFPTVFLLAAAPEQIVLSHWQGLGYYARARNLHQAAQIIVQEHGGKFPPEHKRLTALPGIGPYTAGAILSLAFHQPEPALDGNLIRVFSRLQNWEGLPQESAHWKSLYWNLATRFAEQSPPNLINEALMEFGALVCTPKKPDCAHCPIGDHCQALRLDLVHLRPPLRKTRAPLDVRGNILILHYQDKLLVERGTTGLLAKQWRLPMGSTAEDLIRALELNLSDIRKCGLVKHSITHHRMQLQVVFAKTQSDVLPPDPDENFQRQWIPLDRWQETLVNSLAAKAIRKWS